MSVTRPAVKKIVLHTGNILQDSELIRKVGKTTLEELRASVKTTLNTWKKEKNESEVLKIRSTSSDIPVPPENVDKGVKITVKVFLSRNSKEHVEDAINTVKHELSRDCLHTVIVIPPDVSDDLSLDELKPVWEALQSSVAAGEVGTIGLADVAPALFMELHDWAEVKPSIIQVNLSSCCTIPQELTTFATQSDVQVLTHNDDPEVIDQDVIGTILSRVDMSASDCELKWLARHRVIQTCYGLITNKGYTLAMDVGED